TALSVSVYLQLLPHPGRCPEAGRARLPPAADLFGCQYRRVERRRGELTVGHEPAGPAEATGFGLRGAGPVRRNPADRRPTARGVGRAILVGERVTVN